MHILFAVCLALSLPALGGSGTAVPAVGQMQYASFRCGSYFNRETSISMTPLRVGSLLAALSIPTGARTGIHDNHPVRQSSGPGLE